jgi:hypothetical protein
MPAVLSRGKCESQGEDQCSLISIVLYSSASPKRLWGIFEFPDMLAGPREFRRQSREGVGQLQEEQVISHMLRLLCSMKGRW